MSKIIRVTVWNEFRHEKIPGQAPAAIYPDGIHNEIASFLKKNEDMEVRTATLDEPENGLTQEVLDFTDVLLWWGHMAHQEVSDEVVDRVHRRITKGGMGFIPLHSAHLSKVFVKLMGTACSLKWREAGEKERLWVIDRAHPITEGLPDYIDIPHTEMYGEPFDISMPDDQIFISWYEGGEIFRSGNCWHRGRGKVFYFSPGHESFPIYKDPVIQQIITNAVRWAAPSKGPAIPDCLNVEPIEKLKK